ncbi:hypothetical protein [Cytobacillus sp.]|uniref:hypothetical protein n=1 Tax=Cytobacillus sp. TaxID=2675269 RepID=UPI0028BD96C0|nr:hypothetical protein [Cytobacillus sp.]
MRTLNIVQDLISQNKLATNRPLTFRPGQIISGKVLKLFPNQMAEVQVGSQKIIAQLEVGLSVNDRHFFQVQSMDGQVQLKVMESLGLNGKQFSVENLLRQLNIPVTKENVSLLQFFLREQLPITKDTIHMAAEWLKGSESFKEGLEGIRILLTQQLPFTKDVFYSLTSILKNEPMSLLMENLLTQIKDGMPTDSSNKLSALLAELIITEKEKMSNIALIKLVKDWLSSTDHLQSKTAFQFLQNTGFISSNTSEEGMIQQALEKWINAGIVQTKGIQPLNIIPEIVENNRNGSREELILTLTKLQNLLKSEVNGGAESKALSEIQKVLSEIRSSNISPPLNERDMKALAKAIFHLLAQETDRMELPNRTAVWKQILPILSQTQQSLSKLDNMLFMDQAKMTTSLSNEEQTLINQIKNDIKIAGVQWDNSHAVKDQIKHLVHSIGLSYEHELLSGLKNREGDIVNKADTLKPLLMQLLSEEASPAIKDTAEKLLFKITGFQLLSQEVGPIQQYVFQVPLSFWEMKSDLTMQWSGRKTENGKIDPNFCRVLFYLNLNQLKETIVDLQVQNRIMNISIINERTDLRMLAAPFIPHLKENLSKINYQLSSIVFEKPKEENVNKLKAKIAVPTQTSQVNGVDFRI